MIFEILGVAALGWVLTSQFASLIKFFKLNIARLACIKCITFHSGWMLMFATGHTVFESLLTAALASAIAAYIDNR